MIQRDRIIWTAILALGLSGSAVAGTLYRCEGGPNDPVNYSSKPVAGMKCKAIGYASSSPSPHRSAAFPAPAPAQPIQAQVADPVASQPAVPVPAAPVESVPIPAAAGSSSIADVGSLHERAQIASANAAGNLPLTTGHGGPRVTHKILYKYTDAGGVVHYEDEINKPSGVKAEVKDSHTQTCRDATHCVETGYDTFSGYFESYSYANDCYACGALPGVNFGKIALNTTAYAAEISAAARTYGVDEWLVRAIIHAESNYNPNALSYKGAQGLMQLMPGTASRFGVQNAFAAADNISGGVQYLSFLSKRYNGDVRLIAAAYNAGEGNVDRYGGVPPFEETMRYVDRVGTLAERYRTAH